MNFFKHPTWGLLTAASMLLVTSCGGPDSTDSTEAGTSAKQTNKTTASSEKIRQVNILVDLSGGMAGFVHPNAPGESGSDFQQTITALLSDVQGQTAVSYYFVEQAPSAGASVLHPTTYAEISHVVSQGAKQYAMGTEMPEMLRQAVKMQASKPGTVNVIVSDFIYGPQNQQQVWRVRTDVKDALASSSPLAISVYAGASEYRGNFYPGTRHKPQALHGAKVPYYVWVMGSPTLVAQANGQLLNSLADHPQVHFNQATATPTHGVLTGYEAQGSWFVDPEAVDTTPAVVFSDLSKQAPAHFVVGLDLHTLPKSVQQQFNKTALELDPATSDAEILRTWAAGEAGAPKLPAAATRHGYTHFAQVGLTKIRGAKQSTVVTLRLPAGGAALPEWVAKYSTANDDNIASQGSKTFRLTDVLQGAQDAFAHQPTAAAPVWQAPLTLRID